MIIDYKVKFILRKKTNGQSLIRMRVTLKGKTPIDISTGISIATSDWDADNQRLIDGAPDCAHINNTIEHWKTTINDVFVRYEVLEKRQPTPEDVKQLFNDEIGRVPVFEEPKYTIESIYNKYIETIGQQNSWTIGTYKKHKTIRKHLSKCLKNKELNDITVDDLQRFVQYLLKQGKRNTTISKDYQFVRWFLSWARKNNYYQGNADMLFKPRLKGIDGNQKEIIYLTIQELRQIENCEIPASKKYLLHARDVFLFCCYTSLRYSDVYSLKKSDVQGNVIRVVTQKTTDALIIELNEKAKAILEKYKDYKTKRQSALPVACNQKYNEFLKELGRIAGLDTPTRVVYYKGSERHDEYYPKWQLLTTHVARRTFVVTALQLGIPVEVIIRWTGHADYAALKPYVAIVDSLKRKEMNKFNLL